MKPLKIEWLPTMAYDLNVSGREIFSALHKEITGFGWSMAGGEANNLLSRIHYRRRQLPSLSYTIVRAIRFDRPDIQVPFNEDDTAADRITGLVLMDTGLQLGWTIRASVLKGELKVFRRDPAYNELARIDYGLALRRDALGWMDMTLAQLQAFKVKSGRIYLEGKK